MEIKPLASVPSHIQARLEKRQAEPLTDEEDNTEWAGRQPQVTSTYISFFLGTISIGTPAQKFLIDFDSKRLA